MSTKIITDQNIEKALAENKILFLDFWATWCEPCKVFSPIFERVAQANPDILFGKINTETEHLLSSDFAIRSIPTLVILKEGHIIFSESGVIPEYVLKNLVEKARTVDVSALESDQ